MDYSLLTGAFKDIAQVAQKQVSDLQQKGSQFTESILVRSNASTRKELEFRDGPFGFELEGQIVVSVEVGGQAEALGVQVGDVLVEISGYKVPKPKPTNSGTVDHEELANRRIRRWLKDMPRPGRLTFKPPLVETDAHPNEDETPAGQRPKLVSFAESVRSATEATVSSDDDLEASAADGEITGEAEKEVAPESSVGSSSAQEVAAVFEDICSAPPPPPTQLPPQPALSPIFNSVTPKSETARGGKSGSKAEIEARQVRASLGAERRKSQKFLEEMTMVRQKNKELLDLAQEATKRDADSGQALEIAQATIEETNSQLKEASARIEKFEKRLATSESQVKYLSKELHAVKEAYDADLDVLKEEHEKLIGAKDVELKAKELRSDIALQELRVQAEDAEHLAGTEKGCAEQLRVELQAALAEGMAARAEAHAAKVELDAVRTSNAGGWEESDPNADASGHARIYDEEADFFVENLDPVGKTVTQPKEDVNHLLDRISNLEKRNSTLQRKLSAQVFTTNVTLQAGAGQGHPVWLPWASRYLGPRYAAFSLKVFSVPDKAMRVFTSHLLKHTCGLWVFYVHLTMLYLLLASVMVYSSADASNPLEIIRTQVNQVAPVANGDGLLRSKVDSR